MATDTSFGMVRQFEDFLITVIADKPEIDIQSLTGAATEILAGAEDGRLQFPVATTDDDDIGAVSFNLNWTAGTEDLYMEARCFISAITDNKYFIGFGDSLASSDESSFSATTDTVTIDTMSDAFGILFDNDATTKNLWAVAGLTDSVTVGQSLISRLNPIAATAVTFGVKLSESRQSIEFYVNGEIAHRVDNTSALVGAVDLCPMVQVYEQGTAFNLDVDYLYARKGRSIT